MFSEKGKLALSALLCTFAFYLAARDFPVAAGEGIQPAIDAACADGGGRVVVREGVHPSGTLYLKSKVELHLEKGAVILGGSKPEDYDDINDPRVGVAPERSYKVFISCTDAEDVAITGEGVIDGVGVSFYDQNIKPPARFFRKPPIPRPRMVQFFKVSKVRFEGVTFKDSPGWTFWLRDCEDVEFKRARIVGDQRMINNDGIDFDGCRRMRVTDCDIQTGDDCVVMRAIRGNSTTPVVCEDLVVRNCRLNSACQCVRLGCPSDDTIRNARFENCVMRGNNGIMSFHPYHYLGSGCRGYCRMSDISFSDCDIDCNSHAIFFRVQGGITLRDFGNTSFFDMKIKSRLPLVFEGCAETVLKNICLNDIELEVLEGEPMKMNAVSGIEFDDVKIKSGPGKASGFKGHTDKSWESDKAKR
jgi:hypothetical protein